MNIEQMTASDRLDEITSLLLLAIKRSIAREKASSAHLSLDFKEIPRIYDQNEIRESL